MFFFGTDGCYYVCNSSSKDPSTLPTLRTKNGRRVESVFKIAVLCSAIVDYLYHKYNLIIIRTSYRIKKIKISKYYIVFKKLFVLLQHDFS